MASLSSQRIFNIERCLVSSLPAAPRINASRRDSYTDVSESFQVNKQHKHKYGKLPPKHAITNP
eukprot:CCRYP_020165-RA/>CCRYP_020165-RA protein AED:0.52 eAED:0.76 QI:0/0/0/1/0/0/2/0/63